MTIVLPSGVIFLMRGTISGRLSDAAPRNSSTYTSLPYRATPVGDLGLEQDGHTAVGCDPENAATSCGCDVHVADGVNRQAAKQRAIGHTHAGNRAAGGGRDVLCNGRYAPLPGHVRIALNSV